MHFIYIFATLATLVEGFAFNPSMRCYNFRLNMLVEPTNEKIAMQKVIRSIASQTAAAFVAVGLRDQLLGISNSFAVGKQ